MNSILKKGWIRASIFFIVFLIVFIFSDISSGFILNLLPHQPDELIRLLISQSITFIYAIVLVCVFRKFLDKKSVLSLGFNIKGRLKDILMAVGWAFLIMAFGFVILQVIGFLAVIQIHFNPKVIFLSLLLLFIVAIIEEIVFRGYLLNNLMESINRYVAVVIISIIFGVLHSLNPNFTFIGLLNLILFGGLLGLYYVHTKNLWFPIFFHLSWNYFQGPILGFSVSGKGHEIDFLIKQQLQGNSIMTGGRFGFEGSLTLTFLLIVSIFGLQKFFRNSDVKLL